MLPRIVVAHGVTVVKLVLLFEIVLLVAAFAALLRALRVYEMDAVTIADEALDVRPSASGVRRDKRGR